MSDTLVRGFTLLYFQAKEETRGAPIKIYNRNSTDYSLILRLKWYLTVKNLRKHSQQQQKSGVIESYFCLEDSKDILSSNIDIA